MNKRTWNKPYAGFITVLFFLAWVLATEFGPMFMNSDLGAFVWTTFHFIINPSLGILISIFLIWHASAQRHFQHILLSLISISFPIIVSFAGFSGNIYFVELLGINFN